MHKELRHALAVVIPSDRLGKQVVDIQNDQLVTRLLLLVLGNRERVCDDDLLDAFAVVHLLETVAAEQTVCSHAVYFRGTTALNDGLGRGDPGC